MRIEIPQRTDLLLRIHIQDQDGAPVPLTGASLLFVAASQSGKEIIRKSTGDGIEVTDEAEGRIAIGITHDDSDVSTGVYIVELRLTDIEGARYPAGRGLLTVTKSIIGRDDQ